MTNRDIVKKIISDYYSGVLRGSVIYRQPYTYVSVTYAPHDEPTIYGHGFSKVCWPDQWDEYRGQDIALAKAARDVVSQLSDRELQSIENLTREAVYDDIPF